MELRGEIKSLSSTFPERRVRIELETNGNLEDIEKLKGKDLTISLSRYRKKRSLDANAFLWKLLGDMAAVLGMTPWDMYLDVLKKYGQYTHIKIIETAYPSLQKVWRETQIVEEMIEKNPETGEQCKYLRVLCFFGSSTYDSKEFSVLLNGVIADMAEMGLERPTDEHLKAIIEEVEKRYEKAEIHDSRATGRHE